MKIKNKRTHAKKSSKGKQNKKKHTKRSQKRKQISLEMKLDILKRFKSGEKTVDIGRALDIAPTTIRTICNRDAEQIQEFAKSATPSQSKQNTKIRCSLMVEMESLLSIWIENQLQRGLPMSQMLITNKALSIFNYMKSKAPTSNGEALEFEASHGWYRRFKARTNLHNASFKKAATAVPELSSAQKFKLELQEIIEEGGYSVKQVLNIDETELFWKKLPKRTYIAQSEKSYHGFKCSQERFTILLGGNAAGDFKFKPMLIYRTENPSGLKGVRKCKLPIHWRANRRARLTCSLFKDWLENCAVPELKAYCAAQKLDFKMLLLLDNSTGHPYYADDFHDNIKVVFMPTNFNATILKQPMEQGVIGNFKCYYLRLMFRQLVAATDPAREETMTKFWKKYDLKLAIKNINLAWQEIEKSCLNGVWREIWPECVYSTQNDVNAVPIVRRELAELAAAKGIVGMTESDIDELVLAQDAELNNNNNAVLREATETFSSDPIVEEKQLTTRHISKALDLISQAMEIFTDNDPEEQRSTQVTTAMAEVVNCYKETYLEYQAVKTLYRLLTKKPTNQSTEITFDTDSSSSSD